MSSPARVVPDAGAHPHLTSAVPPGWVRMDCHLHTVVSGDSVTALGEVLLVGAQRGLDVIAVTDHHAVSGAQDLARRSADAGGPRIVVGEEIRTPMGEIVGLFLSERVPYVLPLLEAASRIRDQGGLVYAPHPFDDRRHSLGRRGLETLADHGLLDVVEVFNAKVGGEDMNTAAATAAADLELPVAAGSDAHDPEGIGAAFVELPAFEGATEYLAALRCGRIAGHLFPHANRYLPRSSGTATAGRTPLPVGAAEAQSAGRGQPATGLYRREAPDSWT